MDLSNQNKNINNDSSMVSQIHNVSPNLGSLVCPLKGDVNVSDNTDIPRRILFSDGSTTDDRIKFWRNVNRNVNRRRNANDTLSTEVLGNKISDSN